MIMTANFAMAAARSTLCRDLITVGASSISGLFPSLRLGFVVAPPKLYRPFLAAKWITDRHTETGEQRVISEFIREGHLARYIRRMQHVYFDRQQVLIESLKRYLP